MTSPTRIILILITLTGCYIPGKENPTRAIREVLDRQVTAWNNGNIDEFMEGYWKSDSVQFIGSSVVMGWKPTLERYKKSYPDKDAMGTLRFELLHFSMIDEDAFLVTGKYYLTRKNDAPSGIFTLLFRKMDGKWVIVSDHTS